MPPKKRKAGKTTKQREQENEDNVWNEFYAQLIEYGLEHDTYQVPSDYEVETDDGRTLKLGLWLQKQGENLLRYSKTHPHWYNDLADLLETGKLWFDVVRERTPTPPLSARAPAAQSSRSSPALSSMKKDYAIGESSDEDEESDSSADARQKKTLRSTLRVDTSVKPLPGASSSSKSAPDTSLDQRAMRARASAPPAAPAHYAQKQSTMQSRLMESELSVTSSDEETFHVDLAASRSGKAGRGTPSPASASSAFQKKAPGASSAASAPSVTRSVSPAGTAKKFAHAESASAQTSSRNLATSSSAFDAASKRAASPTSSSAASKRSFKSLSDDGAPVKAEQTSRQSASSSRATTPVTPNLSRVSPAATHSADTAPRSKRSLEDTIALAQQAAASGSKRTHDLYSVTGSSQVPLRTASTTPSKGIERQELSRANVGNFPPRRTLFHRRELPPDEPLATHLPEPRSHRGQAEKAPPAPGRTASSVSGSPVSMMSGSSSVMIVSGAARGEGVVGERTGDDTHAPSSEKHDGAGDRAPKVTGTSLASRREPVEPAGTTSAEVDTFQTLPEDTGTAVVHEPGPEAMDVEEQAPALQTSDGGVPAAAAPVAGKEHVPESFQVISVESISEDAAAPSADEAAHAAAPAATSADAAATAATSAVTVYVPPFEAPPLCIRSVSDGAGSGNEKSSLSSFPSPQGAYSGADVSTRRRSIRENKLTTDLTEDSPESMVPDDRGRFADESKDSPRAAGSLSSASSDHEDLPQGVELAMFEPEDEDDLVIIAGRRGGRGVVWQESQSTQDRSQGMSPAPGKRSPTPPGPQRSEQGDNGDLDGESTMPSVTAVSAAPPPPAAVHSEEQDHREEHTTEQPEEVSATPSAEASTEPSAAGGDGTIATSPTPQSPPSVPMVSQASPQPAGASAEISSPVQVRTSKASGKSRAWDADSVRLPQDDGRRLAGRTVTHDASASAEKPSRRSAREEPPPPSLHEEAAPEFVAFAYTRGADSRRPMLGIGMVCNGEQESGRDSLFLMVMVPKDANLVKTEYMLDFQENITVHSNVVLARGLSFEHGHRGGVFSAVSQEKIADILRTYTNLQPDRNFV